MSCNDVGMHELVCLRTRDASMWVLLDLLLIFFLCGDRSSIRNV